MTTLKLTLATLLAAQCMTFGAGKLYKDPSKTPEARAEDLLKRMTLEEKVEQLSGVGVGTSEYGDETAGIFGTPANDKYGIPQLVMGHGITGVRSGRDRKINSTYMMAPIGMASTWDPELYYRTSEAIAKEMVALNQHLSLGATFNIIRHPLGGRNWECFSEDPYLTGRMAVPHVKAMQANGIISGPKHYVANNQENHRFDINNVVDERTLREIYLPAFKAAIVEGGALNVMGAYNRLNGTFMCENKWLLTDVLRGEWGFKGFALSDFGNGVRSTVPTAMAGMNIEMHAPKFYGKKLVAAVENGELDEAVVDQLLREKLYTMFYMGLFDGKWKQPKSIVHCDAHKELALEVARKAAILLKNDGGILPLKKSKIKKLAVIGPNAKQNGHPAFYYLQGGGSGRTYHFKDAVENPADKIEELAGRTKVTYSQGCGFNGKGDKSKIAEAVSAAKDADAAVLVVGLHGGLESEGRDRKNTKLPGSQVELIKQVAAANPNTIVVIAAGSYLEASTWIDDVKGVIFYPYCGERMGTAMAEVLFGEVNPGGKLTFSYPKSVDQYPEGSIQTTPKGYSKGGGDNVYSEGIFVGYRYFDKNNEDMLFPFGFGLSYTTFKYENMRVDKKDGMVGVAVTVKNTGDVAGDEIVQLYVQDVKSSEPRPLRELKGFERVSLKPGESKQVKFILKDNAFAFWSPKTKKWTVEPGEFKIHVGTNSRDLKQVQSVNL